ncbi:MAG: Rieske 2Fe-2S domain-containing protein [Isosphaeraceae bacterium]|nr:Rieske 2Fe-2S domain-containing protein [Isosphaeraceae bacterium]
MRSAAHFQTHPIHPMLVAFPLGFLFGSLVFDAAGRLADWPSGWTTGAYLNIAAIATGLVAAVPGLIDYLYAVPPQSSGKSRAFQHMLINVSALASFALAWIFRDTRTLMPGLGTLVLEVLGVGLVTWGGWLGGTLVYRNQIGVDHRYAGAGRWKEQKVEARPGQPVTVAQADELKPNQMKLLRLADGRRLVLGRTESGYVVFDDHCTHKGGSLADGVMACGIVTCPWHGSQFDVASGQVKSGPAERPISTYRVEQADGEVRLIIS